MKANGSAIPPWEGTINTNSSKPNYYKPEQGPLRRIKRSDSDLDDEDESIVKKDQSGVRNYKLLFCSGLRGMGITMQFVSFMRMSGNRLLSVANFSSKQTTISDPTVETDSKL